MPTTSSQASSNGSTCAARRNSALLSLTPRAWHYVATFENTPTKTPKLTHRAGSELKSRKRPSTTPSSASLDTTWMDGGS